MKISNFIVMDRGPDGRHGTAYANEYLVVPIAQPLPVIVRGRGCVGLGVVTKIEITDDGTTIKFDFDRSISDAEAEAYYNLYRNQASNGGEDRYSNTEAVIPGAISRLGNNRSERSNDSRKGHKKKSSGGLLDYMDDGDIDW